MKEEYLQCFIQELFLIKIGTVNMKTIQSIMGILLGLSVATSAMAKTEKIILKNAISMGEEAVIFPTTKGEVILNYYALPEKVANQIKSFKKGQCLEIQSKYGFFKDTGDGSYISNIAPCKSPSSKVTR